MAGKSFDDFVEVDANRIPGDVGIELRGEVFRCWRELPQTFILDFIAVAASAIPLISKGASTPADQIKAAEAAGMLSAFVEQCIVTEEWDEALGDYKPADDLDRFRAAVRSPRHVFRSEGWAAMATYLVESYTAHPSTPQ